MTAVTPVEKVTELLSSAGYRKLATPLSIAGLNFDIPAAFVGAYPSPDLILVADTAFETDQRILRKVEGVARALDVARSRRPLTAILVGPRPTGSVLDAMTKVCRVLPVGSVVGGNPDEALQNWLAILLPLALPEPNQGFSDPLVQIVTHSGDLRKDVSGMIDLAPHGADAIQSRLHELLEKELQLSSDQTTTDQNQVASMRGETK
jgi:hypothetical protein